MSDKKLTSDHVPPLNLFPVPRTSDLITVPACGPCNKSFEKDDDYFRLVITVMAEHSPIANRLWREKAVRGTLRNSPALKAQILRTIGSLDIRTPAGLYIGSTPTIAFDGPRTDRVIHRIVSALHWHHYGTVPRLPVTMRLAFSPDPRRPRHLFSTAEQLGLWNRPSRSIAGGIFQYAFDRAVDNPDCTAWLLVFYSAAAILVTLTPEAA